MNQTPALPIDPSLIPSPALEPNAIDRLARLTRDYARLSEGQAGLSSVLGGAFLLLVALVEVAGHGWRFTWIGALAPLPSGVALTLAILPFLWLGARAGLRRWTSRRFGLVEPVPSPLNPSQLRAARIRTLVGRWVLPGVLLGGLIPVWMGPLPVPLLRSLLLVALAATLPWVFPGLKGRLERFVAILLFIGAALLLSGIQMAVGDTLLAYPLAGTAALAVGIRDHRAFLRVRRELEGLA